VDYDDALGRFGRRVQALRAERRITQEQMAERIDVSVEHVSYLERGDRAPSFETILGLARALDVSVSYLMNIDRNEASVDFLADLPTAPAPPALVEPVENAITTQEERQSDIARLRSALQGVQELQHLAREYEIADIFQDNGGKVLECLILLGLRTSPGREGNDAVDADGHEYELKTVNAAKSTQVTTHHHLNRDILSKYRAVRAWYFAVYDNIQLTEIYRVLPSALEPKFREWDERLSTGSGPLNNPKIPLSLIKRVGDLVYPRRDGTNRPPQDPS